MATTFTPGSTYKVQQGETLSGIAKNFYSNPDLWFRIYKYTPNQTQIDKAQSGSKFIPATSTLKKDLSLYIPPLPKPGLYYTVLKGDNLSDIAHAAYGDPKQFPKISNNPQNKPPISDQDHIEPGWVLFIPPKS